MTISFLHLTSLLRLLFTTLHTVVIACGVCTVWVSLAESLWHCLRVALVPITFPDTTTSSHCFPCSESSVHPCTIKVVLPPFNFSWGLGMRLPYCSSCTLNFRSIVTTRLRRYGLHVRTYWTVHLWPLKQDLNLPRVSVPAQIYGV